VKAKIQTTKSKYRYSVILLKQLVKTDFKLRYQSSVLGYLWTLLKPFSLFLIMYLVFAKVLGAGNEIPHFGVYLLLGIVIWNYFTEVTTGSLGAIVSQGDLLRKVNFPRYVIILAGSFSALINLCFNMFVVLVFMIVFGTDVQLDKLIFVPVLIGELFVFSLAIGFLLSALYVRFRDISFIWEVAMQGAFFATPIMYAFSLVTSQSMTAGKVLMSSPVAQLMQDMRYILITPVTDTPTSVFGTSAARLIPLGIVLVTAVVAAWYFRRRSRYFAEEV
jgi:ABC-2 type transport system permease protein